MKELDVFAAGTASLRSRRDGRSVPVAVPFSSLRKELRGGLWPGLHVLAGPVGAGKTQLALQLALESASAGAPTEFVARSIFPAELAARVLGLVRRSSWSDLYAGHPSHPEPDAFCPFSLRVLGADPSPRTLFEGLDRLEAGKGVRPRLLVLDAVFGQGQPWREILAGLVEREASVLLVVASERPSSSDGGAPGPAELFQDLDLELRSLADTVWCLRPAPLERPRLDEFAPWDLILGKRRAGVPSRLALRFNGTWFEDDDRELDLVLGDRAEDSPAPGAGDPPSRSP